MNILKVSITQTRRAEDYCTFAIRFYDEKGFNISKKIAENNNYSYIEEGDYDTYDSIKIIINNVVPNYMEFINYDTAEYAVFQKLKKDLKEFILRNYS